MHYKTMIFELLQQRPQMHEHLRKYRLIVPVLDYYATELRSRHLIWKELLPELWPEKDQCQIESEALEMALDELETLMPQELPPNEDLSLDEAMTFLQSHTRRE